MNTTACSPDWRVAALRGVAHAGDHEEALVAIGAGQYLRIPIAAHRVDDFMARLGQRVWVDLDRWAVRLDGPAGARHA